MILLNVLDRAHNDHSNMKEYLNKSMANAWKGANQVSPYHIFSNTYQKLKIYFFVIGYTM